MKKEESAIMQCQIKAYAGMLEEVKREKQEVMNGLQNYLRRRTYYAPEDKAMVEERIIYMRGELQMLERAEIYLKKCKYEAERMA